MALGFSGPEKSLPKKLGLKLNEMGNIETKKNYGTQNPKIFIAGDCRRGQSLIVWAISEGREAANEIDSFLTGNSLLTKKNMSGDLPSI